MLWRRLGLWDRRSQRCSDGSGEVGDREALLQNDLLRVGFMQKEVSRVACPRLLPCAYTGPSKCTISREAGVMPT